MTTETHGTIPTTRVTPRTGSKEELLREVPIIASRAEAIVFPALCAAIVSLAAGGVFWFLCFSHYLFDSFKSGLLCLGVLAAITAPGLLLLRFHQALKVFINLPARVPGAVVVPGTRPKDAAADAKGIQRHIALVKSWFNTFGELRDHLAFAEDDLARVAGVRVWAALLTNPLQVVLLVIAMGVSGLLAIGALLSAAVVGLRSIF
jgi:hypothetical protein